jgi:flagellar hook assembly protein FlgD
VKLSIYNQRGQLVKQLVSEGKNAGTHTVSWDGRDAKGRKVSSGIYFARLTSDQQISQKKLIYMAQ